MIFADKLIRLRKKAGWSQEELAEKMNVTRQSVSKWEQAQSLPDLEKMIRLSELFGVSLDYLVKDEMKDSEGTNDSSAIRSVSMEEANTFLSIKARTSKFIALGVFLCILSPICLLILGALSETKRFGLTENAAGGIGMIVLLIIVTAATAIFIACGRQTASFAYLEKEVFETEYGVARMVSQQKTDYNATYTRNNIIGSSLCIMAVIPLFVGAIIDDTNELLIVCMLSVSMVLAGIGVVFFVGSGIIWASYEKLLQEGEYTKTKKANQSVATAISTAYWLIITAVYLGYSLSTNRWDRSWIIWVIAGVIFPVIAMVMNLFGKRK